MKFDLHCHTKEGSFDSKIPVREYINKYRALGYDGFMITDHNSYRGCRAWHKLEMLYKSDDFTVLRGIEYDTKDAGHVLVILPDNMYLPLLHIRGMRLQKLIKVVHSHGGILGLAHPFGIKSSSAMGFKLMSLKLIRQMDFVEVFNSCEKPISNRTAKELAMRYNLPGFGGTDAHDAKLIGMAYTEIDYPIHCNNDLIDAVKIGATICAFGTERDQTIKGRMKEHWLSQVGYKIYNRGIAKLRMPQRKLRHSRLIKK